MALGEITFFLAMSGVFFGYMIFFIIANFSLLSYSTNNKKYKLLIFIACITFLLFNIFFVDTWPEKGTGGGPIHTYSFFGLVKDNKDLESIFSKISIISFIVQFVILIINMRLAHLNKKINILNKNNINDVNNANKEKDYYKINNKINIKNSIINNIDTIKSDFVKEKNKDSGSINKTNNKDNNNVISIKVKDLICIIIILFIIIYTFLVYISYPNPLSRGSHYYTNKTIFYTIEVINILFIIIMLSRKINKKIIIYIFIIYSILLCFIPIYRKSDIIPVEHSYNYKPEIKNIYGINI